MVRTLKTHSKQILFSSLICILICCLVIQPQRYIASVYQGMVLFATNVAPALFPFFFFTKLLTSLGGADYLGKALRKPVSALYRAPGSSGYVYVMSVLSGYPVGSRLIADLYDNGCLTTADARKISTFTSTSGPLFIVGTVGTLMLHNPKCGYYIMLCHFVGALVNGLFYRGKRSESLPAQIRAETTDNILSSSITNSIWSVLIVGGYIAVFSMVVDVLDDLGVIGALAEPLAFALEACNQPPELARGIVMCLIEITRGCQTIAACGAPLRYAAPFVAAMLSFGGLSILFQSMTFLSHCKVKVSFFLISKLTQAAVTFWITYALCPIFL